MMARNPLLYLGASCVKKSCGPIILPAQYEMNNSALTVALLVKPPTLELTIDNDSGMPAENVPIKQIPTYLDAK
jgi:hypothetical protein